MDQKNSVSDELGFETTVGGLRAIETYYRGIREISSGSTRFFQSESILNTPLMGTMHPENYRGVADLSTQADAIFELTLNQVIESYEKFVKKDYIFDWISIYTPIRTIKKRDMEKYLIALFEQKKLDTNRLCLEVPSSLLFEEDGVAAEMIQNIRNRGFHVMLTNFGESNFPFMKLSEFAVDFVMLSPKILSYLEGDERSATAVHSLVQFADSLDASVIADGVSTVSQAETLFECECSYVAGPISGKYMKERYFNKK